MNNFYRFFRYAALMAVILAWMIPAKAQHPFTLTTASDITNGTQHYYLIQSIDLPTFYALPESGDEDAKVSTTSIPNANMRWCFVDAGSDSDHQYYYIVNSTGRCLYRNDDGDGGIRIKNTFANLSSLSGDELNKYKYYLETTGSYYFIHPKGASNLYLNKKGTNTDFSNYIKASTYNDSPSIWNFVAVGDVIWPQPFTISTNADKHYYKFQNVTNTSFCLSKSEEWATVSNTSSNANVWYFLDAGTDATYSNCHYYFIVNASTEKYLYYVGGTDDDVAKVLDYNSTEADKYRFLIVDAAYKPNNNFETCYTIVPKLKQTAFSGKDSFAPMAMSNDSHLLLKSDRGTGNYDSHWNIVSTDYVEVEAPEIINNYDGTITLSTPTLGATIYYTTNGTTPSSSNGTIYSSAFSLGNATVIQAIAYLGEESSCVTTYNVPKYSKPTISFDSNTSEITITSEGTVYYNTGNGNQENPTPASGTQYSAPFTVTPPTTVKAIATHAGYLTSDVATWSNVQGYLTFNVLTNGTICWKAFGTNSAKTIQYRKNDGTWEPLTSTTSGATISVENGDVVRFKGSNSTYATSKNDYSGFEGGTATFNIEGNIMSLIYGDNFANNTALTGTYNFCSIFKKAKVISAENLVLPATSLTNYAYRAMFSYCETLVIAPELPATTLAQGCYWYMFEKCAITTAPELNATTLVQECYGNMFNGCSNLNYIKCLATSGFSTTNCLNGWVSGVSSTGTFVKDDNTTSWSTGASGIPTNWTVVNDGTPNVPTISCDGFEIELSCTTTGAVIYYQLDHSGNYTQYTTPITITGDTFIECYSEKDGKTSVTISQTCEYDNRTIYEYANQSLDSWTYGGNTITTPYSVNAIDGHSSNYAKGTFNFETDVNLRGAQPTYLWFQHADQSATIYVDDNLVEKHWGGYNAFFVDISNYVHKGTNHIKVALKNNEGNVLAPYAGDFNFNATLGNVKLFTSLYMPSMSYGYDGFHITSTVSSAEATINVKTTIPTGATVVCTISGDNCNYTETKSSTGNELVFTTTITNPRLWNGTIDPYLYNVKVEIYHDNELYHSYERPYGLRFYEYVFNNTVNGNSYTGFLLNGQPYYLRGVCMHDDLEGKANALNDTDYTQEFDIITELGCNFLRLAHYPHPKEVYDKCDQLGIIVQTEAPWVNRSLTTETEDYWTHLEGQCADMVNQHYNHPCIIFWGVGNEINTTYTKTDEGKNFVKSKIEGYRNTIRLLMPNALVGYTVSHGTQDGLGEFNNPTVDWIGQNIYVGWYVDKTSNNPTKRLTTAINNATTQNTPCAYSEYGCGGTPSCHSDNFKTTTTTGNNPRHDIEYQMWLHEGHIAAIRNKPELLFTSQWQLFDIAVYNRTEGYKVSLDGETVFDDIELQRLNNKGLVERDHRTKKDTYYLYKAWWNQTDKFVHICGKDYEKLTNRVIKCYTNDDRPFKLYVNDVCIDTKSASIDTKTASDYIILFEAQDFNPGDVIRVKSDNSETIYDTFTFTDYSENYVFTTKGNWNDATKWTPTVPAAARNVTINAACTIPAEYTAKTNNITIGENGTLTIADGGQLYHNNDGVNATAQKNITAYTVSQNEGESLTNGWYFIASPITDGYTPTGSMVENTYDLYRLNPTTTRWENYQNTTDHPDFTTLNNGTGYLYANSEDVTLQFTGTLKPYAASESVSVSTGWNLVGNPFAYNVYANRSFYKMNEAKTGVEAVSAFSTSPIAPCTGIVVKAETDGNVIFSKEAPTQSHGSLQIALCQANTRNNALLDNAIVSFNEDSQLGKFYFGRQRANIYIPQGAEEYAIVNVGRDGACPISSLDVNFMAWESDTYTIAVNPEGVEMDYLHLVDNITGADIDLLRTPSYTFNARSDDYASRFKLVFVCEDANDDNETFAFINNGNIIITADVEGATLQVVDVMGRIVYCRDAARHVSTNGLAPGVYVLRLINGGDVKTQKIVIR